MKEIQTKEVQVRIDKLLLALTGSVGVLAMPRIVDQLLQTLAGEVHVLMSRSSQRFIRPLTMELCCGNPVYTDAFSAGPDLNPPCIDLAGSADMMLVMPATANIIGKAAYGITDDLVSGMIQLCKAPVVFAPSMNRVMWKNPVVQNNVGMIRESGGHVIPPAEGYAIADRQAGQGAMAEFDMVLMHLLAVVNEKNRL